MKEATGELSMTVLVVVGAIILIAILSFLRGPAQNWITESWSKIANKGDAASS